MSWTLDSKLFTNTRRLKLNFMKAWFMKDEAEFNETQHTHASELLTVGWFGSRQRGLFSHLEGNLMKGHSCDPLLDPGIISKLRA